MILQLNSLRIQRCRILSEQKWLYLHKLNVRFFLILTWLWSWHPKPCSLYDTRLLCFWLWAVSTRRQRFIVRSTHRVWIDCLRLRREPVRIVSVSWRNRILNPTWNSLTPLPALFVYATLIIGTLWLGWWCLLLHLWLLTPRHFLHLISLVAVGSCVLTSRWPPLLVRQISRIVIWITV